MKLYRAFATVGGLTMVSRVFGFVRDMLIAGVLGTGAVADAFFVAFRFPNLFRRLFGEGAFNSAFVPLFAKRLEGEGQTAARRFAEEALAGLLFVLLLLTALAEIAMPWLMYVLAPGFSATPDKFDLAVLLTRIAFPYLLCMSLVALLSGVLNSLGRFTMAAAAPILLNVVLIAALLIATGLGLNNVPDSGIILAWGVAVAGFVQLAALWLAVRRAGLTLGLRLPTWNADLERLVRLGVPGVVSGGVTQLNIVVGTIIASLQAGAVSYLYYADRLYQLPLGIVGVAVGVVLLPDLARHLRAGDMRSVLDNQNRAIEFALVLTLPAAVALAVAAEPIIRVLFERGAFTVADTHSTAAALAAFAVGLPSFVLIKVLQPAYFAREDTRTPMRYAIWNMVVNVAGSLGLFFLFQRMGLMPHVGIALATSVSGWVNAYLLWSELQRRGHFAADDRLRRNILPMLLSCVGVGVVIWLLAVMLDGHLDPIASSLRQAGALALVLVAGLVVYAVTIQMTGVMRWGDFLRRLARRERGVAEEAE
jgi:putative peptidoglycan lipid II flippase